MRPIGSHAFAADRFLRSCGGESLLAPPSVWAFPCAPQRSKNWAMADPATVSDTRRDFVLANRPAFDGAALGIAAPTRAPQPGAQIPGGALGLCRGAALPDGIRSTHHRQGGGAARADPGESGDAGQRQYHADALCRPTADPARRSGALASPHPVGAAFHRRGRRRLHRSRRRAHNHARGRLRHHSDLDLA